MIAIVTMRMRSSHKNSGHSAFKTFHQQEEPRKVDKKEV